MGDVSTDAAAQLANDLNAIAGIVADEFGYVPLTVRYGIATNVLHYFGTRVTPTRPRTITTVEELDALPDGSVIRWESMSEVFEKDNGKVWNGTLDREPFSSFEVPLPATLIYTPTEGDKT